MVEEIQEVTQREIFVTDAFQDHFCVMSRQHPDNAGKAQESDRHLGLSVLRRRSRELVNSARREGERNMRAKTNGFLFRRHSLADRLPFGVNALQHANRLEKVKAKAFLEKRFR